MRISVHHYIPTYDAMSDHIFFDSSQSITVGTGGTFHGAGKYIKEASPDTKIILAEPGAANLIGSGIKTERKDDGSPAGSHPAFAAHPIQGKTE